MHRLASRDPARTPWASNRAPKPGHVQRFVLVADGVEGLVPGRQHLAGVRVEECAGVLVPDRQVRAVVDGGLGGGPPDLVVGGGDDLAELVPRDGAADGEVDVRGEPALGFDGGEVLQVIPGEPAQVLDEPVEQRSEVQRIAGGMLIVVGVRVGGCSVLADPAVRRAGQGDEQRGPERLAIRRGIGLADGPGADRAAGQGSGILAAPGGAVAARPRRQDRATKPGIGDRLVKLADPLIQLSRIEAFAGQEVPAFLRLGSVSDQRSLVLGSRVRVDDGFVVQVPALATLRRAQDPGPLGAGRAHRGQGVPARDQDLLDVSGVDLGPAQLHRPQARAVLGGQVLHHVPGQRCGHPLGPRRPPGGHQAPSQSVPSVSNGPA